MVTREPVAPVFELLLLNVFYSCCGTVLREFCVFQITCVLSGVSCLLQYLNSEFLLVLLASEPSTPLKPPASPCPILVPPGVEETVLAYQELDISTGSTSFHLHFSVYLVSPSVSPLS